LILGVFFASLILLLVVGCSSTPNKTGAGAALDTPKQERTQEDNASEGNGTGEFVTKQFFITGFT